ncbi:MAG: hypothetical protein F2775_00710 [Actinobacteria bacterium]|nr:hypothetical protein [Actinomycetota bacterium]
MTDQPQEKPEWFEHVADASDEKSMPINRLQKNRVLPVLAIIAIALSATAYGLSKSPSDAETPAAPKVSAPQASTPQASTPQASTPQASTPQASTPQASTPQASTPQASTPQASTPQPNVSNQAPLPKISAPTVPNGARGGDDAGDDDGEDEEDESDD